MRRTPTSVAATLNGGTCIEQINGFTCICTLGYFGSLYFHNKCDIHNSTCQHNGRCIVYDAGRVRCNCTSGYEGDVCERDKCSDITCQNGTCKDGHCICLPGTCFCAPVYTYTYCQTKVGDTANIDSICWMFLANKAAIMGPALTPYVTPLLGDSQVPLVPFLTLWHVHSYSSQGNFTRHITGFYL